MPITSKSALQFLWDAACIGSIVGIWPRFIEPNLLNLSEVTVTLPNLPKDLEGLKILQFSDLHISRKTPQRFLNKILKRIHKLHPDLIVFSGDFLCNSTLDNPERLRSFFKTLKAPYGIYATLGNHDYAVPVGINKEGEYDAMPEGKQSDIALGFSRLLWPPILKKRTTLSAKNIGYHDPLLELLKEIDCRVLCNETCLVPIKESAINICGLEEHTLGKTDPVKAFQNYQSDYPGIILLHNPDAVPSLTTYPGDLILCGHTHGGQINIPGLWNRFARMENGIFKKGALEFGGKRVYISRGIGSSLRFRLFATPEMTLIHLKGKRQ